MTPRMLIVSFAWLAACAATRDIYVGSDFPVDAGVDRDSGRVQLDAAPASPAADGGGEITPVVCAAAAGDCDGERANGCEADLRRDARNCGQCGRACPSPDCACRDGEFVVACAPGRADCDANPSNGCEVDILTTMQHCGACGRLCHTNGHDAIAAVCTAGQCRITCQMEAFPEGDCDGNPDNGCETQLWANDEHCGMCGRRCSCGNGVCQ